MYGMVNQGIQSFVLENFGAEDWADICNEAGLDNREFESMLTYPDDTTYALVDVISKKYKMSSNDVLSTFGDYWVNYSSNTRMGQVLRFGGQSLTQRLEMLNEMHERIKMTMPHLKPPSFEFEQGDENVHKLHYASDRNGLESMVIGLVKGLGRETGQAVEITQDPAPKYPDYKASFTIVLG